ncbi:TetR/AcrR family transcriptional regulator [Paenibacillus sp. IB182496]|uniref:TetR/AcrR family transcriptional regulator n=1 Tax=Paenibacillus sabuli TaxID=2772509 RepID=A0A927BUZ3_9BACL|nr:TetR/AcrR family transcriptional regulator [Paenibacillus sabuli]MBD2846381.1 TetR/AcrR family transcriptional regulator [Paenibacillus sabuli]
METAHRMVVEQGMEKVNLSKVGAKLGTTHAAIYKYFSGKEELWTELALSWLDHELARLFPFDTMHYTSKKDIVHDWLWVLSQSKYDAYVREPEMFKLYTAYIDRNPAVLARHINDLVASLKAASGIADGGRLVAILMAFSYFSAPAYADNWLRMDFQAEFEAVWKLIEAGVEA